MRKLELVQIGSNQLEFGGWLVAAGGAPAMALVSGLWVPDTRVGDLDTKVCWRPAMTQVNRVELGQAPPPRPRRRECRKGLRPRHESNLWKTGTLFESVLDSGFLMRSGAEALSLLYKMFSMNTKILRVGIALVSVGLGASARADVIGFEGVAPDGNYVSVTGDVLFGDYVVRIADFGGGSGSLFISDGMTYAVPWDGAWTRNGTDFLLSDSLGFEVFRADGRGFDLQQFEGSHYWNDPVYERDPDTGEDRFVGYAPRSSVGFSVVGELVGGGTLTQEFHSDLVMGFDTFQLGQEWTNLSKVTFRNGIDGAFENLVVRQTVVPDRGGTLSLLGVAAVALWMRRRRASV